MRAKEARTLFPLEKTKRLNRATTAQLVSLRVLMWTGLKEAASKGATALRRKLARHSARAGAASRVSRGRFTTRTRLCPSAPGGRRRLRSLNPRPAPAPRARLSRLGHKRRNAQFLRVQMGGGAGAGGEAGLCLGGRAGAGQEARRRHATSGPAAGAPFLRGLADARAVVPVSGAPPRRACSGGDGRARLGPADPLSEEPAELRPAGGGGGGARLGGFGKERRKSRVSRRRIRGVSCPTWVPLPARPSSAAGAPKRPFEIASEEAAAAAGEAPAAAASAAAWPRRRTPLPPTPACPVPARWLGPAPASMSDGAEAGISFAVPSQPLGMIGGCPLLCEDGLGRRAAAGEAGAAAGAFAGAPQPPGTFWNEESGAACPEGPAARAKAGGAGARRTTVSYVINEESPGLLQTAESGALQSLKEACEAGGALLETLHFGKQDCGETAVLDRFYNAGESRAGWARSGHKTRAGALGGDMGAKARPWQPGAARSPEAGPSPWMIVCAFLGGGRSVFWSFWHALRAAAPEVPEQGSTIAGAETKP